MEDDAPRETIISRIRELPLGETITFSDPVPPTLTLAEAVDNATEIKSKGYYRFHKTVARAAQETHQDYSLATQLVWNDRLGLFLITTITRDA